MFSKFFKTNNYSGMTGLKIDHLGLQVSVSSAVGGTSSALTGGSFANGAITGAFTTIFNHMQHYGDDTPEHDDYSRYKKSGKLITSGRADALEFMIGAAKSSGMEVSMFLLEDGSYFVNPWDRNKVDQTLDFLDTTGGRQYAKEINTRKRIRAQYHYGPSKGVVPSIGSTDDMNYSWDHCISVYHVGEANTYAYPKRLFGSIDYSGHKPTIISTEDFLNQRGKTISFEHHNNN